jgi:hypothetical protein
MIYYADGNPLQIAFDTEGMVGLNEDGTRVRYTIETGPGSSGAPCFDIHWNLFAVHQLRESKPAGPAVGFKQGIPAGSIRRRLRTLGKEHWLGDALE